jgi:hypothetical protein
MKKVMMFVGVAVLSAMVSAGLASGAVNLGDALQITKYPILGTCNALLADRGPALVSQFGGVSEGPTKICICQSDGAAVPLYQWCSITITGASTVVCAGGSATVCP